MVSFENNAIRSQAVALWQEAFGDSEEYINFFIDSHNGCRCLTLMENGELLSALYLIDGTLSGAEGYYLFAAATFKKFRGKGCMAKLLDQAEQFVLQEGKSFIALVPAQKSLFGYYSRFGYKTAFYAVKHTDFTMIPHAETSFIWCNEHIEYIKKEHDRFRTVLVFDGDRIFNVFNDGEEQYIKAPADSKIGTEYGMLLPLNKKAEMLTQGNSYIGLTLE